jgi:radical SAM protein with 4Fe4S-binding SPASM domain
MDSEKKVLDYSEEHVKEILLGRVQGEMPFPKVVLIDTISYCNLKCVMCPHKDMHRKNGIMSWDLYKKIIDEIAVNEPDAQIWITYFGEGMILKDLPEKIKYARDKGLSNIILNSNANLINREYSKRLIESGLNGLYVGIDAIKPNTYEQIRVGGNLEKVTDGVIEYKQLLEESGKSDQRVVVQFVEMDINASEVEDFIEFWHTKHGIQCKIRPMVSWAGRVDAANLKNHELRIPCYWAMNTINITDTGQVTLCSVDLECRVPMGNVNDNTIKEIWETTLKEFRMNHRRGKWGALPDMCRECDDWQSGYAQYM